MPSSTTAIIPVFQAASVFMRQLLVGAAARAEHAAPYGKVERSHRVDDQEFYQLLDQDGISDDIHLFNDKLREWEDYYNYHRPHGALGGQTPYERLVAKTRAEPLPKA